MNRQEPETTDGEMFPVDVVFTGNTVTVNSVAFRVVKARGDGDCLFHCFDMIDGRDNGPSFYRKMTDTPADWGDHRSIRIYSEITNRNIFVVIPGRDQAFVEAFRTSSRPRSSEFLLFSEDHFDLLKRV